MKTAGNKVNIVVPLAVSIFVLLSIVSFLLLLALDNEVLQYPKNLDEIAPYPEDSNQTFKEFENFQRQFSELKIGEIKTENFREQLANGDISKTTLREELPSIEQSYNQINKIIFLVRDLNQYSEIGTYYPSHSIDNNWSYRYSNYSLRKLTWAVGDYAIAIPAFHEKRETVLNDFLEVHQLIALYCSSLRRIDDLVGMMNLLDEHYIAMHTLRSKFSLEQRIKLIKILSETPDSKELITKTIWCWFVAVQTRLESEKKNYDPWQSVFIVNENFSFNTLGSFLEEQIRLGESGDWHQMKNHQKEFNDLSNKFHLKNYRGWKSLHFLAKNSFTDEYQIAQDLDQKKAQLIELLQEE